MTEEFIATSRKDVKPLHRQAIRNMQTVLADCLRAEKRRELRKARAISLQLDDKAPYRCLLYKASLDCASQQKTVSGILCVLKNSEVDDNIVQFEEDYAMRVCDSILVGLTAFCTDASGCHDADLESHVLQHCVQFAGDAALLKAGKLLKSKMPNLVLAVAPEVNLLDVI